MATSFVPAADQLLGLIHHLHFNNCTRCLTHIICSLLLLLQLRCAAVQAVTAMLHTAPLKLWLMQLHTTSSTTGTTAAAATTAGTTSKHAAQSKQHSLASMSSIGGRVTAMLQHLLLKLVTRLPVQSLEQGTQKLQLVEQDAAVLAALSGCVAVIAAEVPHCSYEAPLKLSEVKLLQQKRPAFAASSTATR
jgi:hypothetical protein